MLYKDICKILGYYLFGLAIALSIPFFLAAYFQFGADPSTHPQPHTTIDFFWSILACLALAGICRYIGRHSKGNLYRREGLVTVVIIWFLTPAIAGLPFYLSKTLEDPFHAYFEATSGFTTTGATTMQAKKYDPDTGDEIPIRKTFYGTHTTVYSYWGTITPVRDSKTNEILYEGIEAVSKALLFWRSFTQWLGGMGIVLLFVAILPVLGVGGKVLFQAEVPGPIKDSLTPRIKETASQLWKIYVGLSILQVILLMVTNHDLDWFDAITITFSTVSTGGFTAKTASIGAFNNVYTDWIIIAFMILAGINFSLYFYSLRGKFYRIYEPEFFLYLFLILFSSGLVVYFLVGTDKIPRLGETEGVFSLEESIRYGTFQLVSAMTTTGFVTKDYDLWPATIQALMLIIMFVGGMSGSTAGGMKVARPYMLFYIAKYKVESLFRPETVRRQKLGKREIDTGSAIMVLCYFLIVISIAVSSTFIFIVDGIDPQSALSLVTLLINNIGIGFRMAAPTESFAFLSDFGLIFSSLLMVFGRLEFLAVLAVMVPAFWQQNK
ncbi:MAG: Trk system potassium uptake protein TrkH [Chlamydiae bacterium]|nr:Trk system potassium uptake protein TrkH [Chlamydiota bacterium]